MDSKRIFITGCASSGTTLMRRLFYCFSNVHVVRAGRRQNIEEIGLRDFIAREIPPNMTLVGKRRYNTIFSADVREATLERQVPLIKQNRVLILNMIRDGRDVVLSTVTARQTPISPRRWIHSMRHRQRWPKLVYMEVRYEDLVTKPDAVMGKIMARFGLKRIPLVMRTASPPYGKGKMELLASFSDYPSFVPESEFTHMRGASNDPKGRYVKRPLTNDRIGKDLAAYRRIIKDNGLLRDFERELKLAGYIG